MISIIKSPLKYSPSNNPIVYTISGSSTNLLLFKLELIEANTLATVYTGNIFPTPINPQSASINLSNQLTSLVRSDVDNSPVIVIGKIEPIVWYNLKVTEYGVDNGVLTSLGSAYTTPNKFAFEAELDIVNYTSTFTGNTYLATAGNTSKFLTFQPNVKEVNAYSFEQLYMLQDGYGSVMVNINVEGANWNVIHTGGVGAKVYTISPAIPATRAQATLRITGTTVNAGDNIGVYANSDLLGAYTAETSSLPTITLASQITEVLQANSLGYTISRLNSDIYIQAPTAGVIGNSITLSTALMLSATTASTITSEQPATATFTIDAGLVPPSTSDFTNIDVDEFGTNVNLIYGPVSYGGGTWDNYIAALVTSIDGVNGYSALQLSTTSFRITARTGLGDSMNTNAVTLGIYNPDNQYLLQFFSGGITYSSSSGTTFYSKIGTTMTGFTGGSDMVAEVTGSTEEIRQFIQSVVDKNLVNLEDDLAKMSPTNRWTVLDKITKYFLPALTKNDNNNVNTGDVTVKIIYDKPDEPKIL